MLESIHFIKKDMKETTISVMTTKGVMILKYMDGLRNTAVEKSSGYVFFMVH